MCDGGNEGSVKVMPISHNGIAGGRIGWELCGSVNRGPMEDNRVDGVLGVDVGVAVYVEVIRWKKNAGW